MKFIYLVCTGTCLSFFENVVSIRDISQIESLEKFATRYVCQQYVCKV